LTKLGTSFLDNPSSIKFILNNQIEAAEGEHEDTQQQNSSMDTELLKKLKDLRERIGKKHKLPPYVIFQEQSLEEMCIHYPITISELKQIQGVGTGKAMKFGQPFIELIKNHVEEHEIDRPIDFVIKSAANKSSFKISIIQNIDRQLTLSDIAASKGLTYEEILKEVESIVSSGTKLNLNYYIDDLIDEERQDEIVDYFRTSEVDSVDLALAELGQDEYTREEIQLMRIKFLSEFGN
jgi:ATP-dependent DNA helicase RecQ